MSGHYFTLIIDSWLHTKLLSIVVVLPPNSDEHLLYILCGDKFNEVFQAVSLEFKLEISSWLQSKVKGQTKQHHFTSQHYVSFASSVFFMQHNTTQQLAT